MELVIGLVLIWYVSGCVSFAYWWTHDHDLTTKQVPLMLIVGWMGPLAYPVGRGIHRPSPAGSLDEEERR